MDFIVGQFPALDTAASGEVDLGEYTEYTGGSRGCAREPIDCPRRRRPDPLPGAVAVGTGGYTYGDFGRIAAAPEVHADGEIWAQTLWDLRTALGLTKARGAGHGRDGAPAARAVVPGRAQRHPARRPGAVTAASTWTRCGRCSPRAGWASSRPSLGGDDASPAESFALPPAPDGPKGTITGRVTPTSAARRSRASPSAIGGLAGLAAVLGDDRRRRPLHDRRRPRGHLLQGRRGGGGYDSAVSSLSVTGGFTINFSPALRRNWASVYGGGGDHRRPTAASTRAPAAARRARSTSRSRTGWSTQNGTSTSSSCVQLPSTINVTQFALDPAEICGDSSASATAGYRVETSPDGTTWTVAQAGTFASANRHQLNFVTPTAGATGVRFVAPDPALRAGRRGRAVPRHGRVRRLRPPTGGDTTAPETTITSAQFNGELRTVRVLLHREPGRPSSASSTARAPRSAPTRSARRRAP